MLPPQFTVFSQIQPQRVTDITLYCNGYTRHSLLLFQKCNSTMYFTSFAYALSPTGHSLQLQRSYYFFASKSLRILYTIKNKSQVNISLHFQSFRQQFEVTTVLPQFHRLFLPIRELFHQNQEMLHLCMFYSLFLILI